MPKPRKSRSHRSQAATNLFGPATPAGPGSLWRRTFANMAVISHQPAIYLYSHAHRRLSALLVCCTPNRSGSRLDPSPPRKRLSGFVYSAANSRPFIDNDSLNSGSQTGQFKLQIYKVARSSRLKQNWLFTGTTGSRRWPPTFPTADSDHHER